MSRAHSAVLVPDDCLRKQSRSAADGWRTARGFRAVPGSFEAGDTVAWIGSEVLSADRLTGLIRDDSGP